VTDEPVCKVSDCARTTGWTRTATTTQCSSGSNLAKNGCQWVSETITGYRGVLSGNPLCSARAAWECDLSWHYFWWLCLQVLRERDSTGQRRSWR